MTTPYDENGLPQAAQLTAYYFGGAYEVTGSSVRKYYSFAGQMIAMNDGTGLKYLLTDHLGSMVAVTDDTGTLTSQQRYLPFGGERQLPNYATTGLTDYTYTGQRELDEGMGGLMDYKARFYSPYLNHFTQPDTIVPNPLNPQALNRYSYANNNPHYYTDPTGHWVVESNKPQEELRRNSYIRAAERVKKKDPLSAHLKEYYIVAAAYYQSVVEEAPEEVITGMGSALEHQGGNVRRNGWNSTTDAQSVAADAVGFEALGIGAFGANLAGVVIPSPGGRLGGPQHQALQTSLANSAEELYGPGYWAIKEYFVRTPGGQKSTRFVDVAILGPEGPVAFYQIGRGLNNGNPIARERYALVDIILFGGRDIPTYFIPYNR